jgi:tRNA threonylcarbamoyl adenosine modification protein YjeE
VISLSIPTPEAMERFGARLAAQLVAGDLVALNGELGAGKTTMTRGLGEALGVRGAVTSPTFVLARTHPRQDGGAPLVHVDAYRLSSPAELDDLDIDYPGSIVVVEWAAGMLDGITDSWLDIGIERPVGGAAASGTAAAGDAADDVAEPRLVTITPHGPRWSGLLETGWPER